MRYLLRRPAGKQRTDEYASVEDFRRVFAEGGNELCELSFQLMRDHDKAEHCLVAGREDCIKATRIFKEWARSWAKRTIIQNAIREVKPRPSIATSSSIAGPNYIGGWVGGLDTQLQLDAVLALEDFDRFVYVMSVLERYSKHDCALLLGCTCRQVEDARMQTFAQLTGARRAVCVGENHSEMVQEQVPWWTGNADGLSSL